MRKHRLAERLLIDVIGLEWEYVHDEACRWEHVMSERVERRLLALLDNPTESPYGNPIPGLAELGTFDDGEPEPDYLAGLVSLVEATREGSSVELLVRRLGEPLQTDPDLLARLAAVGIKPGSRIEAQQVAGVVRVAGADAQAPVDLPDGVAGHVFVAA